jgi:hypothetical protein
MNKERTMKTFACLIMLLCGLLMSSCMDVAQWQLRTFYGLDCRTEKLVDGKCVPVKKGGSDVRTAQP